MGKRLTSAVFVGVLLGSGCSAKGPSADADQDASAIPADADGVTEMTVEANAGSIDAGPEDSSTEITPADASTAESEAGPELTPPCTDSEQKFSFFVTSQ